jgi:hypothetical protein
LPIETCQAIAKPHFGVYKGLTCFLGQILAILGRNAGWGYLRAQRDNHSLQRQVVAAMTEFGTVARFEGQSF